MRVTDKIIQERAIKGMEQTAQKLSKTHHRIATTKNISRPSDDPIGSSQIMANYKDLAKVQQTLRNCENADNLLSYTDTILERVSDMLIDARQKASVMASDTVGSEERKTVANEVAIMIDQMLQLANSQFSRRYIFSGQKILDTPYIKTGDNIEYVGDEGEIGQRVELGQDTMVVNFPGSRVFGYGTETDGIFKVLKEFKDALDSNNTKEINSAIGNIDDELDKISIVRGEIGVKISRIQSSIEGLNSLELSLKKDISQVEDVDMAEEAAQFMSDQEAYQAALHATATILKLPKLSDYI
ncbi:TPA: flagellar hook-associated protein 3 [Candidatus Poribacteria bacterium]|nr:flagellar hook-associated protein 3 [Candidatus Poribacteria bacterium]